MVEKINSFNHFKEVTKGNALVEIMDSQSMLCIELNTALGQLSKEIEFPIYQVDVNTLPEVARELKVMDVPVTFIYKEGKLSSGFIGAKGLEEIKSQHIYVGEPI